MAEVPFSLRVATLLAIITGLLLLEVRKPAEQRHRWREYVFLLCSGVAFAVFGVCFDLITSSVSPEYFVFGKGIEPGAQFRIEVAQLGAVAGFSAGAIGAAILLAINPAPEQSMRLLRTLWIPIVLSGLVALFFSAISLLIPFQPQPQSRALAGPELGGFSVVWYAHIGAYVGGAAGVFLLGVLLRNRTAEGRWAV